MTILISRAETIFKSNIRIHSPAADEYLPLDLSNPQPATWISQIHQRLCRNGRHSIHPHNRLRPPRNLLTRDHKPHLANRFAQPAVRCKSDQDSPRKLQGPARNNPCECEHDISPPVLWSLGDSWIRYRCRSRPLTVF